MADYYNKTRGPLSIALKHGGTACVGSKRWVTIPASEEGSPGLFEALRNGFLVKSSIVSPPAVPAVVPAVVAPVVIKPAPVSVEVAPKTVATPADHSEIIGVKATRKGR